MTATSGIGTIGAAGAQPVGGDRAKVEQLAHEFEAMMLLQMLRQMRKSMLDDGEESGSEGHEPGLGGTTLLDTLDSELARQLSLSGGLGLSKVISQAYLQQLGDADPAPPPALDPGLPLSVVAPADGLPTGAVAPPDVARAVPAAGEAGAVPTVEDALPDGAQISSGYGWRQDPFSGETKFHGGIDLAAAYGQAVDAPAGGRVVFAGEAGTYGLSVVVEHAGGVRTRYAHLSAIAVQPGEVIGRGQTVGRVGQTGRATGPHLHFEVTRDGRRLDPEASMALLATGLKDGGQGADFPTARLSQQPDATGAHDEN